MSRESSSPRASPARSTSSERRVAFCAMGRRFRSPRTRGHEKHLGLGDTQSDIAHRACFRGACFMGIRGLRTPAHHAQPPRYRLSVGVGERRTTRGPRRPKSRPRSFRRSRARSPASATSITSPRSPSRARRGFSLNSTSAPRSTGRSPTFAMRSQRFGCNCRRAFRNRPCNGRTSTATPSPITP